MCSLCGSNILLNLRIHPYLPGYYCYWMDSRHIKNVEIIYRAIEVGIDIICFPLHTSHKLKPLDVSFMGSLKSNINKLLEQHIKENSIVRLHDLVGIYKLATVNMNIIRLSISGFRKIGICPFNESHLVMKNFFTVRLPH